VLPLRDRNPTVRKPVITIALIIVNVAVFLLIQKGGTLGEQDDSKLIYEHAAIPCEITQGHPLTEQQIINDDCNDTGRSPEVFPDKSVVLSVFVSMFLHGSWLHIGGNMLFLWVFGNNVEDKLGWFFYLLLYLVGGAVAMVTQVAADPSSTIPVIGASGAIATIMGAYLVWFPRARVLTVLLIFFIFPFELPAWIVLSSWFVLQFFTGSSSDVAWMAHVGGFIFGVLVAALVRKSGWWQRRNRPVYRWI
jgi:membrane associated rhomboid family serine protease